MKKVIKRKTLKLNWNYLETMFSEIEKNIRKIKRDNPKVDDKAIKKLMISMIKVEILG